MLTHIEWPFYCLFLKVSCQFVLVFTFVSTADNCFELLVLISAARETKNSQDFFVSRTVLMRISYLYT